MIARWALPIVSLLMAMPAAAQTKQQTYDAAQAAFDNGNWAAAENGFAKLLAPAGRSSRSDGVIRSRYATALGGIGRLDEAIVQARRALGELGNTTPDEERAVAALALAKLLHIDFQAGAAADAYEIARDAATPESGVRLDAALGAVQAVTVADPPRAVRLADTLIAGPIYAATSREQQAYAYSLKARAQLNAGYATSAKTTIAKAVSMTGAVGTGNTKVNMLQAIVRGDAALIYARGGNFDRAREYLAYSGGGYLPRTGWWGDGNRQPPVCDDTVKPDDVAVVAFAIDEHGKPVGAEAVYASQPGPMAAIFARAVRDWEPSPTVGKLSLFWRSTLRIEMRCITRPAPIAIAQNFERANTGWWRAKGILRDTNALVPPPDKVDPREPAVIAKLSRIYKEKSGGARAMAIDEVMVAADAPADVRAYAVSSLLGPRTDKLGNPLPAEFDAILGRLESAPGGSRAAAWLRLEAALGLEASHRNGTARPLLEAVLALSDDRLPHDDAIRIVATLHLAMIDEKQGAGAVAAGRLRAAGLDAEQCSAFDVRPLPVNTGVSNAIFPEDAARWGFDGFVKEAFDITADGHVGAVRTVIAYPAFVFGRASEKAVANFRYQPPTLNGKVLGCTSMMRTFRFNAWRPGD